MPHHFYGMINDLQGKEALYNNPGIALRSFVIANCFNDEFVEVDGTVQSVIEECEEFSNSHDMIALIINMLSSQFDTCQERIHNSELAANTVKDTYGQSLSFLKNMMMTQREFIDYCSSVPLNVNSITTTQGTHLKHHMFEFKKTLEQLTYELSLVPFEKEPA
jgi:hypothetical protein